MQSLWAARFPELQHGGLGRATSSPQWYSALAEGEVCGGQRLAGVGARIVAEVFIGLLQLDPGAFLATQPNWVPTLPRRGGLPTGDFTMVDLLTLARVDPTSRGQ